MASKPVDALTEGVVRQVAIRVREILQTKFLRWEDVSCARPSLARALSGRHNLKVSTLVAIADALGYQVTIHFREKPREVPPDVVH